MTIIASNPLDVLTQHIETFKSQFEGDISDWELIEKYLLMPLFDIDTPHELELSDEKRDRLYNILRVIASQARNRSLQQHAESCWLRLLLF